MSEIQQEDDDIEIVEYRFKIAIDPELEKAAVAEEAAISAGVDPGPNHGAIARLKNVCAENAEIEARMKPMRIPVRRKRV